MVNVLNYEETKIEKGEKITTKFEWISSVEITEKNAEKLAAAGRRRWKIENQGFNRQKHWQGNLEHACSWDENAQKNHYLMEQIADFMKQLYEYYYLNVREMVMESYQDMQAGKGRNYREFFSEMESRYDHADIRCYHTSLSRA